MYVSLKFASPPRASTVALVGGAGGARVAWAPVLALGGGARITMIRFPAMSRNVVGGAGGRGVLALSLSVCVPGPWSLCRARVAVGGRHSRLCSLGANAPHARILQTFSGT